MAQRSAAVLSKGPRFQVSKGLLTVLVSTVVLYALCAIAAPSSVAPNTILGTLEFASILAIAGLGQMLVIQQAGIDLSVAGAISLAAVIVTAVPDGDNSKLGSSILLALGVALGFGLLNGFLIGYLKLNPIIATLGSNAALYGLVMGISQGIPRSTTPMLMEIISSESFGLPNSVYFALVSLGLVVFMLRKTVAGRRFESIGSSATAAATSGLRVKTHQGIAYVWAQLLYCLAGIIIAGVISEPNGFMGETYLLTSVAVVVLGGTSLLGGRGLPTATVVAALFLSQLDQFVLALGVSFAVRTLIQAAALAIGVAIYTVNWPLVRSTIQKLLSTSSRGQNQASLPPA